MTNSIQSTMAKYIAVSWAIPFSVFFDCSANKYHVSDVENGIILMSFANKSDADKYAHELNCARFAYMALEAKDKSAMIQAIYGDDEILRNAFIELLTDTVCE